MNRGILRVPLMYQSADLLFFALLPTQARELTKQLTKPTVQFIWSLSIHLLLVFQ